MAGLTWRDMTNNDVIRTEMVKNLDNIVDSRVLRRFGHFGENGWWEVGGKGVETEGDWV